MSSPNDHLPPSILSSCILISLNNRFVVFSSLSVTDSSFLSSEFYRCCVLHCYYTISLNPSFV
ncbi:unnamed protein product [Brassica napus]|uniref:(rape) hypothetical protein n=1 Tax=Brassica napus TaxID=3708 RepID=A0A816U165_BRANA|nr:unnamed protein product [Brassica napus]